MLARCRERGLGTMTWEIARHLGPSKVLVVARDKVDTVDEERFPGARWTALDRGGRLGHEDIDWITSDVDVLYSAETFYDPRLLEAARRRGVPTALHGMWEYLPYRRAAVAMPRPDLFLAPNPWHLDEWPQPCELLPVPVAGDRFVQHRDPRLPVRTIVHAAGATAKGDRNGTTTLLEALRFVRQPVRVIIRSQGPVSPPILRNRVELEIRAPATNYWQVFDGADAAVLPRRYGGLSLPLQEASALGLPVLGLAREHDAGYHHAAIVHCRTRAMGLPAGPVERADIEPIHLARAIDHLVADRDWATELAEASSAWARGMTWEALSGRWRAALGSLAPTCAPSTS